MYGAGAWSSNVLIDESLRCLQSGITPPNVVPSIAAGAAGDIVGSVIPYFRFLDLLGRRVSPLSAAGATVSFSNQVATWTGLPTASVDGSVSHIQGLRSVDGALARVAWTRQLGATTVVEDVSAGLLGEAHPAPDFTEMPLGHMNLVYGEALWVSGNQQHPERVFRSALGEMERYEQTFVQTDGERVLGMFEANQNLMFGGKKRIYRTTAFGETDLTREVEKPDMGLINFHGICNLHGVVILPTTVGFQLYNGTFNNLQGGRMKEFIREYAAYEAYYERAQGFWDPVRKVYKFGPVPHSSIYALTPGDLWVYWVLDGRNLLPDIQVSNMRVAWGNDARAREDATSAVFYNPGSAMPTVVVGSEDGHLRQENYSPEADDDSDSYSRAVTIEPAPCRPQPISGNRTEGYRFDMAWNYMVSEVSAWRVEFRAGGPYAHVRTVPDWYDETGPTVEVDVEPEHKEHHILSDCAGDLMGERITATLGPNLRWSGWGAIYSLGLATRGLTGSGGGG